MCLPVLPCTLFGSSSSRSILIWVCLLGGHSDVLLEGYFCLYSGSFLHPIQHEWCPKGSVYGGLYFPLMAIHCTGIGRGILCNVLSSGGHIWCCCKILCGHDRCWQICGLLRRSCVYVPLPQRAETPQVRAMPLDSHHNNSLMTTDSHIFFTLCDCNYGFNCNCDGCVCNIVIWILLYIVYSLRQSCRSYGFIVWTRACLLLEVRAHSHWSKAKIFLDVCHLFFNPFRLCSRFRLVWIGP